MSKNLTPPHPVAPVTAAPCPCGRAVVRDGTDRRAAAGDAAGRRAATGNDASCGAADGDRPAAPSGARAGPPKIDRRSVTASEREIAKVLHDGIGGGQRLTVNEVARVFKMTCAEVRRIEAKMTRKLQQLPAAPAAALVPRSGHQASAGAGPGRRVSAGHGVTRGAVEGGAGRGAAGDDPGRGASAGDDAGREAAENGAGYGVADGDGAGRPLPPPRPPEAEATAAPAPADLLALVRHLVEGILTLAADAQARATLAGLPPQPRADPLEDLNREGMLLASDTTLAASHHLPHGTLKKRLSRLRRVDPDCFIEVANRRPREPQFLYREERVMPVIVALKTGSQRPARKNSVEVCPRQGRFPAARRGQRTGIDNTGGVREIGSRP